MTLEKMREVHIGGHSIGDGHPPFFVAELGICHEGSIDVALELTRAAVEAGADMVKTESFTKRKMVYHESATISYAIKGKKYTVPLADHMEEFEFSMDKHMRIKKYCDELKVPFMATCHDFETIDMMAEVGVAAIKIASPDIVHFPLLRYAASKKLPVFVDTGAAFQYEIEIALRTLNEAGAANVIINHNPSGHPSPPANHDLNIIGRLKTVTGVPIGVADHYEGYEMAYVAVAAGANTIEKPISRDRFVPGPERNYSVSIDDLPVFIKTIKDVHIAMGACERKNLSEDAKKYRYNNRMACVTAKELKAGDIVNIDNITFGRPRMGIGVEHWDIIQGRKLRKTKKKDQFLQWEDLD